MDAICVFLSSFRAAKGRTCHSWTPAGCEPWATDGISLCLYCTMPMLCLRASQLYKLKQTFSFIDSIWLIFLNLCMCVCACVCCVLPSLPWQRQTNIAVESFKTHSFWLFYPIPAQQWPLQHPMMLFTTLDLMSLILWLLSLASCPTYIHKFILPSLNTEHPNSPLFGLSPICHYVEQGNSFQWGDKRM